jgi:hypothetical protein
MATCLNSKIISLKCAAKLKAASKYDQKNWGEFGDSFLEKMGILLQNLAAQIKKTLDDERAS